MAEEMGRSGEEEERERVAGRGPSGRFEKGWAGGPGRTPAKPSNPAPELLRAMRRVMRQEEGKDRSQYERECREWLREDRKGFLSRLATLEGQDQGKRMKVKESAEDDSPVPPGTPDPKSDEGSARVEDLIERLLREASE